jgi:hypothetical protein
MPKAQRTTKQTSPAAAVPSSEEMDRWFQKQDAAVDAAYRKNRKNRKSRLGRLANERALLNETRNGLLRVLAEVSDLIEEIDRELEEKALRLAAGAEIE